MTFWIITVEKEKNLKSQLKMNWTVTQELINKPSKKHIQMPNEQRLQGITNKQKHKKEKKKKENAGTKKNLQYESLFFFQKKELSR